MFLLVACLYDGSLFSMLGTTASFQLLIPSVNLKSQEEDQIRPFFLKDCVFLFVVFQKYVPPLLARVSVGKPDGNFITRADQTNSDVRWLWKVVCVVSSQSCTRETPGKSNKRLAQTWKASVCGTVGFSSSSPQRELVGRPAFGCISVCFLMCQKASFMNTVGGDAVV